MLTEINHSVFGKSRIDIRREREDEVCFYYPTGEFLGGWDRERGGGLGHPNKEIDISLRKHNIYLQDFDYKGYIELENILTLEVKKAFPDFLI